MIIIQAESFVQAILFKMATILKIARELFNLYTHKFVQASLFKMAAILKLARELFNFYSHEFLK